jgi:predicted RNase H-like HicB family nuclease
MHLDEKTKEEFERNTREALEFHQEGLREAAQSLT